MIGTIWRRRLWFSYGDRFARLMGAAGFSTWMYRICLNVAISFHRRESTRRRHILSADESVLDAVDESENSSDDIALLYQFIDRLDALNKALILLYLDGNSYREIADVLGGRAANVHFEDLFDNGEITFDYRMKPGVVRHTNGLALMRAVGIEVWTSCGSGTPDDWRKEAAFWKAAGATHLCLTTTFHRRHHHRIAGTRPADHLAALRAYRDGKRESTAMHSMSYPYSNAIIESLATWYASQPAK